MSELREAYELIKDEQRWCRGALAQNSLGVWVEVYASDAVRWCAGGAAVKSEVPYRLYPMLDRIAAELFPRPDVVRAGADGELGCLVWVNDNIGHEGVLQVFEKAIVETEGSL